MQVPATRHYWLKNAHVPVALLTQPLPAQTREGLTAVDLEIQDGRITQITATDPAIPDGIPVVDLQRGLVFPGFVDLHTHLDKAHTWERSPNPSGNFTDALRLIQADEQKSWDAEDLYRRMEFGLKCAYAHGTRALRTHLDIVEGKEDLTLEVFQTLRQEWGDRLILQAVCLVTLDYFLTPAGEKLANQIAEFGCVLGGVTFLNPNLDQQITRVFDLAHDRQLDVDLHVDESPEPASDALHRIARIVQPHPFAGKVVCGHCCSLSLQSDEKAEQTIAAVKAAGLGVVSLPLCNLYLQDRNQEASQSLVHTHSGQPLAHAAQISTHTPRWRGITLLHELKQAGVPVAVANDNCRDVFHAFGDHDMVEVFRESTRIGHFDTPYADWCRTVTSTPADLMGLPEVGRIGVGLPADLVLFRSRYFSEWLSRPSASRTVLRNGIPIDTTLPAYEDLDDLVGIPT